MSSQKVLVTGATGFVGQYCVLELLRRNFEVHALYRDDKKLKNVFDKKQSHSILQEKSAHFHSHAGDLFDKKGMEKLIQSLRPEYLLHCAWIATPGVFWNSKDNLKFLTATVELLQAFGETGGKRAVGIGTCAEYDWTIGGACNENITPLMPRTIYGQCKLAASLAFSACANIYGFSQAWGRLFFPYGPLEPEEKFISTVIRSILRKQTVSCSLGLQQRDFLHVQDVAEALVNLLQGTESGAFNIGSGEPKSLRDIVGHITQEIGGAELIRFGAKPEQPGEPSLLVADMTRFQKIHSWRPRIDLVSGIKELIRVHSGSV